jgi:MYXO-CTERM domain-containing protein
MNGCLVAVSAPDNSSHNIYMYGGGGKYLDDSFEEVWILTLPMFRWSIAYNESVGLFGNTCHLVGNRYMLTLGGYRQSNNCMEFFGIYDVAELAWVDTYYPNSAYYVPPKIAALVGGTSQGGATVSAPDRGWNNDLEAVFHPRVAYNSSTPPPPTSHTPAIAGGAVGGVLGVAAVIAVLLFLRRRRQREGTSQQKFLPSGTDAANAPEVYNGDSPWKPPQEMYADTAPEPTRELWNEHAYELQGSTAQSRRESVV